MCIHTITLKFSHWTIVFIQHCSKGDLHCLLCLQATVTLTMGCARGPRTTLVTLTGSLAPVRPQVRELAPLQTTPLLTVRLSFCCHSLHLLSCHSPLVLPTFGHFFVGQNACYVSLSLGLFISPSPPPSDKIKLLTN